MKLLSPGRLWVLAAIAASLAAPLPGQVPSRVVAYSGLAAPGAPPAVFDNFNYLAIGSKGGIVFRGRLATGPNTYGIWRESSNQVSPVLSLAQREGTASPLPGFNFSGFPGPPTINLFERFAFKAHVSNGPTFPDSLWVEKPAPTGLTLVAREGAPAPGLAGVDFGILFSHAGYDPLLFDDSGHALFTGQLTGAGVTATNDSSLWYYDGVSASLAAREGDQMPGVPAGHFFIDTFGSAQFGATGSSSSTGPTVTRRHRSAGSGTTHSGTLTKFIQEGGTAPGLASDETLTLITSFRTSNYNAIAFSGIVREGRRRQPRLVLPGGLDLQQPGAAPARRPLRPVTARLSGSSRHGLHRRQPRLRRRWFGPPRACDDGWSHSHRQARGSSARHGGRRAVRERSTPPPSPPTPRAGRLHVDPDGPRASTQATIGACGPRTRASSSSRSPARETRSRPPRACRERSPPSSSASPPARASPAR